VKVKQVTTSEMRSTLKEMMAKEIQQLPEYLQGLPAKDRLDYLIKLMPYVFPKVNAVGQNHNEPGNWSFD
jgi:hypothetical protein